MKKKIKIIIFIILLFILYYAFHNYINNWIFNIQIIGIDKDIIIEKCEESVSLGGYASTHDYYYIDLNKKRIYNVENHYVFGSTTFPGEAGEHYTLKGRKKLTDDEITEILHLAELKSDYNKNNNSLTPFTSSSSYYYSITYQGKTIYLTSTTASKLVDIIKEM